MGHEAATTLRLTPLGAEPPVDPAFVGMDADILQKVVRRFRNQHKRGLFPGGQLVVRRHGHLVLSVALGTARGWRGEEPVQPVVETTPFPCFSGGKAVVAIMLAIAEEQGLIDVNKPIATYWPEFAANGKGDITTLDILTHRGGVLMPAFVKRTQDWGAWSKVVEAMVEAKPSHRRGNIRYHPLEYGWILAEVLQRVTRRGFREFLREELAEPAQLRDLRFGAAAQDLEIAARPYYMARRPTRVASFEVGEGIGDMVADPALAAALVPGAGLVTDALTLAAFYEVLVRDGEAWSGERVLKPETIRRWTDPVVTGWDRTNQAFIALGRGFFVGGPLPDMWGLGNSEGCFGHAGLFGVIGFGDHKQKLAAAIVTNGHSGKTDLVQRMLPLCSGLRSACK